jgi:hypothetical protein
MILSDFKLVPAFLSKHKGSIKIHSSLKYEVFGPFGSGYNIRVTGKQGTANLKFTRDYAGAIAITPNGKFEMSAESIFNSEGVKILQLIEQNFELENCDELLLAIFIVNHHFFKKSGPFKLTNNM